MTPAIVGVFYCPGRKGNMTQVIIIQGQSLDSFYGQTIEFLEAKYHSYPPQEPDLEIDPRTAHDLQQGERQAAEFAGKGAIR